MSVHCSSEFWHIFILFELRSDIFLACLFLDSVGLDQLLCNLYLQNIAAAKSLSMDVSPCSHKMKAVFSRPTYDISPRTSPMRLLPSLTPVSPTHAHWSACTRSGTRDPRLFFEEMERLFFDAGIGLLGYLCSKKALPSVLN